MKVSELMTRHSEFVRPDMPIRAVAQIMRDRHIGCVPIGTQERILGIITDRDIACRAVANTLDPANTKVEDIMSEDVVGCFEDQSDAEALRIMEEKGIRHLPVFDRQDRVVGMVSFSDLAFRSRAHIDELLQIASRDSMRRSQPQPAHL